MHVGTWRQTDQAPSTSLLRVCVARILRKTTCFSPVFTASFENSFSLLLGCSFHTLGEWTRQETKVKVERSHRKWKQRTTKGVVTDTVAILLPFVTSQRGRFENLADLVHAFCKSSRGCTDRIETRCIVTVEQNSCAALCSSVFLSQPLLHVVAASFSSKATDCCVCSLDWLL